MQLAPREAETTSQWSIGCLSKWGPGTTCMRTGSHQRPERACCLHWTRWRAAQTSQRSPRTRMLLVCPLVAVPLSWQAAQPECRSRTIRQAQRRPSHCTSLCTQRRLGGPKPPELTSSRMAQAGNWRLKPRLKQVALLERGPAGLSGKHSSATSTHPYHCQCEQAQGLVGATRWSSKLPQDLIGPGVRRRFRARWQPHPVAAVAGAGGTESGRMKRLILARMPCLGC